MAKEGKEKKRGLVMMPAVIMPEGDIPADMKLPVINFVVLPRIGDKIHLEQQVTDFAPGRYVVRDVVFQPLSPTQIVHRIVVRPMAVSVPFIREAPQGAPEAPAAVLEARGSHPGEFVPHVAPLPAERVRHGRFEAVELVFGDEANPERITGFRSPGPGPVEP